MGFENLRKKIISFLIPNHPALPIQKHAIQLIANQLQTSGVQFAAKQQELSAHENELVNQIRSRTHSRNVHNISRTEAYWSIFTEFPELHWALLAHMVSRNSGWNMTDLKSNLYAHLLPQHDASELFSFLERANALIFHDAYPQLLLYKESRKAGANLFHLLPYLGVSVFMHACWTQFWNLQDSVLLTEALIINEQQYIQKRVVENAHFQKYVLNKFFFKAQSLLQQNQVVFPYLSNQPSNEPISVSTAGLILENFADLSERIQFGKKLYGILFGIPQLHQGIIRFAKQQPHTGSRADYWTQLFTMDKQSNQNNQYNQNSPAISHQELHGSLRFFIKPIHFYSYFPEYLIVAV